jgi:16S rRNA (adenine(1408)-N(1))-methyltransferase
MEILKGKKSDTLSHADFVALAAQYSQVAVDIGTGDGKFIYHLARNHPDWLCIGLDAARENLVENAAKIYKKPAKGGLPNALYVISAIENLPPELDHSADVIYINFPWGSLLRGLVLPDAAILNALARLAKPHASLTMLVNYNIFDDPVPLELRDLPAFTLDYVDSLSSAYQTAGLSIVERGVVGAEVIQTIPTLWAKRVLLSPNAETVRIVLRRV